MRKAHVLKQLLALRHAPDVQVSWTSCFSFYKVALTSMNVEDQLLSVPNIVLALSTRGAIPLCDSSIEDRSNSCAHGCYGNQLWHGPSSSWMDQNPIYHGFFGCLYLSVLPANAGEKTKTVHGDSVRTYGTGL